MSYLRKLFSIIIVNLDQGDYLEQALLSIFDQDFTDYELIVIDGGSSDKSVDILKKYSDKIRYWESQPDRGQSHAFNKGFAKAQGEFFFWLNADDLLLPNALQVISDAVSKNPSCKWFAGNSIFFDKENMILRCRRAPDWCSSLLKNGAIYIGGPSSIFHHSLFEAAIGFDESLYYTMDSDLWMRFINMGYKFKRINAYIWGFRIHEQSKTSHSLTSATSPKMREEELQIQKKNNYFYSKHKARILFLYKMFNGCFFFSLWDSNKLKGKKINVL